MTIAPPSIELQAQLALPVFRVEGRYVRENRSALEKLILQLMQRKQFAQVSLEQVAATLQLELPLLEVALRNLLKLRHLNLLEPSLSHQLYAVRFNQLEVSPLKDLNQNDALFRSEEYCYDFLRQQVLTAPARPSQARLLSLPEASIAPQVQEQARTQLQEVFIERQNIHDPQGYRLSVHQAELTYSPVVLSLGLQLGRAELELFSNDDLVRRYLSSIESSQWQSWVPTLCAHLKKHENLEVLDQAPPQDVELISAEQLAEFTTWQFKRTHGSYPGIKIHVECTKSNPLPSTINFSTAGGNPPLILQQSRFIQALYESGMFGNQLEFAPNKSSVVGDFYLSEATLCHKREGRCAVEFQGKQLFVPVEGLYPLDTTRANYFDREGLLERLYQALCEIEPSGLIRPLSWSLTSSDAKAVNEYLRLLVYMSAWLPQATVLKSMGTVSIKVAREFMNEYQRVIGRPWNQNLRSWEVAAYQSVDELYMHYNVFGQERKLDFSQYSASLQLDIISDLLNAAQLGNDLPVYFDLISDHALHAFAQFAQQQQAYFKWINRKGDLLTIADFRYVRGFNHFATELQSLSSALITTCRSESREQVRELFEQLNLKVDAVKHKLNDSFYTLPEAAESRPVLIVDTNVLLSEYTRPAEFEKILKRLENKYYIVIPEFVIEELNNRKKENSALGKRARDGLNLSERLNQGVNSNHKDIIFQLLDTSTKVVKDAEEMDKKIRAIACSYLLYEVFVLSLDRGNRVSSTNLGLQICPETQELNALTNKVRNSGSSSFRKK